MFLKKFSNSRNSKNRSFETRNQNVEKSETLLFLQYNMFFKLKLFHFYMRWPITKLIFRMHSKTELINIPFRKFAAFII